MMSQEPQKICLILYMSGRHLSKNILNISIKITINLRFLKADPTSRKFRFNTSDFARTHPTWITEQRHRSFGKCYTVHPDEKTR